jgi:hypothetical protein
VTELTGKDVKSGLTIDARRGAGIASNRAARGGDSLIRSVIDVVTWGAASTHEGMVEPDPVSALVSRGASQVVGDKGTAREGRVQKNDTIIRGVARVVGREGSVTEETRGINDSETNAVEVERRGSSYMESFLHRVLFGGFWTGIVEPVGVQGPGGARQLESEASSGVVLVQDIDLSLDLGISETCDRNDERDRRIDQATYGI